MPPELLPADASGVARAADLVRAGEVIAFPTETVYGLMALPERAERIYEVKRRPADKQLVLMALGLDALASVVTLWPRNRAYAERYWPGPLTLVLPAAGGGPSLGVRIPDHPLALDLLRAVGTPVVTTSANLSGEPPALRAEDVRLEGVAAVLDGGPAPGGVPSTVLLADRPDPEIGREGAIPGRELLLFDQAWKMTIFAEREVRTSSAVWHAVCEGLAEEPAALGLLLEAKPGQRRPNLLLGAIHYLVLRGTHHPLAEYFPSAGGTWSPDSRLPGVAAEFVREHTDELRQLVSTRSTQTNEVGRSAVLLPALAWLPQPIALIDAGCSAGLNLHLDRFRYRCGNQVLGDVQSSVELEVRGRDRPPPFPRSLARVAWRAGLDANPLDVNDPDTALWLSALVWPEHEDRRRRLLAAIEIARRNPVDLRRGDVVDDLPALVEEARRRAPTVVVMHSHVLAYVSSRRAREFIELCRELDVWRIGLEGMPEPAGASALSMNGERVAIVAPHGQWIDWLSPLNEDGEPMTGAQPRGASVGVHRTREGRRQWLMLHRCKEGPAYEGDWAWGPPAGSRLPGEPSLACARRELREETGATFEPEPAGGTGRWDVYTAEAPPGWEPRLSGEHDRFEWLGIEDALDRSRPAAAREELELAARAPGRG